MWCVEYKLCVVYVCLCGVFMSCVCGVFMICVWCVYVGVWCVYVGVWCLCVSVCVRYFEGLCGYRDVGSGVEVGEDLPSVSLTPKPRRVL